MIMWIVAGYVLAAAAFYGYIVNTAQHEVQDQFTPVIDLTELQTVEEDIPMRKAA